MRSMVCTVPRGFALPVLYGEFRYGHEDHLDVPAPSNTSFGTQERVWGMVLSLKISNYGAPKLQNQPKATTATCAQYGGAARSRVVGRRLVTLPRGRDHENRGLGRRWVTRRENP